MQQRLHFLQDENREVEKDRGGEGRGRGIRERKEKCNIPIPLRIHRLNFLHIIDAFEP